MEPNVPTSFNFDYLNNIKKFLLPELSSLEISVYPSLPSTNSFLLETAAQETSSDRVVIAEEQSSGRGRKGRSFFSPKGSGLYISILLHPDLSPRDSLKLTPAAAVAVCNAIEKVSGETPQIKWVNDIFMRGKKVGGILTESRLSANSLEYAVIGIGINIYPPENNFPIEIENIAGTVFHQKLPDVRPRLAAEILNSLFEYLPKLRSSALLDNYRKRCFVLGKEISFISNGIQTHATAINIDNDFRLVVRLQDNSLQSLSSGEISIKL